MTLQLLYDTCPICGAPFPKTRSDRICCSNHCATALWRSKNKKKIRELNLAHRERGREYVTNYLLEKGCKRCGTKDMRALEFHHRNRDEKDYTMGTYFICNKERIDQELEKCDVLCRNCHAIVHWEQNDKAGYRKEILDPITVDL